MSTFNSGAGMGSMFNQNKTKKKLETQDDYDKELKALKLEEQKVLAEIDQLEKELPERRKAFNELLKQRAIIDDAVKKVQTKLMIARVQQQSEEQG